MFTDFFDGVGSYRKALSLIKVMKLWSYAIIPAIISVILALSIGFSAWELSDNIGNFLVSWYPWNWGHDVVNSISNWIGGFMVGIVGLILFKYLVLIFSAPFMSFLSEKVEKKLTGNQQNTRFTFKGIIHDMARGIRIAARNFLREMGLTVLILLIGLIPVIGFTAPFLLFVVQAFYAGFGNLDFTLERHLTVNESVQFVKRHRFLAIGNGSVFLLLLMTGVGFLIAPPLATIAGTVESLNRLKADEIPDLTARDFV